MNNYHHLYVYASITFLGSFILFVTQNLSVQDKSNAYKERPNFIFILTDDQDITLGSLNVMKNVERLISKRGFTFSQAFVTSPLCCPSRSSILTGQHVHNHKAVNNSITGGCSSPSWQNGPERETLAAHLSSHGYETFFAGKYLNQYGINHTASHIPLGWDWWYGLVGNSRYYDYTLSINGTPKYFGNNPEDYLTNVIRKRGIEFLNNAAKKSRPFFAMFSTPACHAPFQAEPKYEGFFNGSKSPRTPNFNIANDNSKHWLLRLGMQPLTSDIITKVDEVYANRLATLLTVDDMIGDIYATIEQNDLLDSTYFIFSSDNGYHLGQFSLPLDKREPYEFDINVPLIISGPDVLHGVSDYPVSSIDIAPTILNMAGIEMPITFDGRDLNDIFSGRKNPLKQNYRTLSSSPRKYKAQDFGKEKTLLIEHSGEGREVNEGCEYLGSNLSGCSPDFACKCEDSLNNTYSCLRHLSNEGNFLYCVWDDDYRFEEYYDLILDPFQLNNIVNLLKPTFRRILKMLLEEYQKCKGDYCRKLSMFDIGSLLKFSI